MLPVDVRRDQHDCRPVRATMSTFDLADCPVLSLCLTKQQEEEEKGFIFQ